MRTIKRLFLVLLACLVMTGQAYGWGASSSSDNQVIVGGHMGPNGITPFVEVIKINVGSSDVRSEGILTVGDVMVWNLDIGTGADQGGNGYSVVRCTEDITKSAPFAGVLMEINNDSGDTDGTVVANSTASGGNLVASIAIRGFCQAKIDASASNIGEQLILNGGTLIGSFATFREALASGSGSSISQDIGVLLDNDNGADGVYNVWLR